MKSYFPTLHSYPGLVFHPHFSFNSLCFAFAGVCTPDAISVKKAALTNYRWVFSGQLGLGMTSLQGPQSPASPSLSHLVIPSLPTSFFSMAFMQAHIYEHVFLHKSQLCVPCILCDPVSSQHWVQEFVVIVVKMEISIRIRTRLVFRRYWEEQGVKKLVSENLLGADDRDIWDNILASMIRSKVVDDVVQGLGKNDKQTVSGGGGSWFEGGLPSLSLVTHFWDCTFV